MRKIIAFIALLLLFVGCMKSESKPQIGKLELAAKGYKVAIILANGFKDVEYTKTREVLEKAGVNVVTFGLSKEAVGMDGLKVKVDYLIDDLNVSEFDAIIFKHFWYAPKILGTPTFWISAYLNFFQIF